GSHANLSNTRGREFWWLLSGAVFQILFYWWMTGGLGTDPRGALLTLSIWGIPAIYLLSRRAGSNHPGLVQIRLSDSGCVQYDDLGGPSVVRDLLRSWAWLIAFGAAALLII